MKKILFLTLVAILSFQNVDAQRDGGQKKSPEQIVKRLDKQLNLTDEQEKQITELYKEFFGMDIAREQMREKKKELNTKVNSLLNDEQKTKLKKMMKRQKKNRNRRK